MLKRYEEYKSTTLDFDDMIPANWNEMKVLHLFDFITDKNHPEEELLSVFLNKGVVKYASTSKMQVHKPSDDLSNYQLVKPGDFVLNNQQAWRGSVGVSKYRGIISPAYYVLRTRTPVNAEFLNYAVRDKRVVDQFVVASKGVGSIQRQIYVPYLKNVTIAIPPRPEQDKIVQYLDWKTSEMNRFIHQKKKQIKLLEELKVSEIDKVTKKGLKTSQKLKDSGVQWLGDIPVHWSVLPAKRLFVEGKETRLITDEPCTASQKYGIISQKEYMRRENSRVVIAEQGLEAWKHVNKDDFVISLRSFQGGIEKSDVIGCVTWHYIVLKPNKSVNPSYYKWLLKSKSYISALQATSDFIRDGQDLRYSNFVKVPLLKIPYEEQQQIADYLYQYTKKIDEMISSIQKEISLVEEFKVKLVSDVVTGQVDVRDIKIPTYETETDNIESDDDSNEQIFDESIEE